MAAPERMENIMNMFIILRAIIALWQFISAALQLLKLLRGH